MFTSRFLQPKFLLIFICLLFLFTRLYKITEIPSSLYWDEASIGYNAYAVLQTGRDEWGEFLPLHFRAFGEFKLPVYIYATAASVKIFGLNEFSVRLPAVLFSLGIIILTYFLAKKLSGNEIIGLLSSFFVSISPWFFIFSRTGYEATAGLMFFILGIYLFLHIKERIFFLLPSVVSFILSMYSYNSFRITVPPTLIILAVIHYDTLVYHNKAKVLIVISTALLLISFIPIIRLIKNDSGAIRLQTVGILSTSNKSELSVKLTQNYLSHFNPDFLIFNGDKNPRSQQEGFGQLYMLDLILLPLGLLYIIGNKSKYKLLPLILLFLGPIPAAITKESPHALRAISMVPFISMISAMGVKMLRSHLGQGATFKKITYLYNFGIVLVMLAFFINYFINFINVFPVQASKDWQYGYKKIFLRFKDDFSKYDRVIISDEYAQPYIFALFYQKIDPEIFRQTAVRNPVDQWGFSTVSKFDKFEFGKINTLLNQESKNTLIFASAKELISNQNFLEIIDFLDGETAFRVYQLK